MKTKKNTFFQEDSRNDGDPKLLRAKWKAAAGVEGRGSHRCRHATLISRNHVPQPDLGAEFLKYRNECTKYQQGMYRNTKTNVGIQFGIMYLNRIWVRMSRAQTRCLGKGRKAEEKTRQKEKKNKRAWIHSETPMSSLGRLRR